MRVHGGEMVVTESGRRVGAQAKQKARNLGEMRKQLTRHSFSGEVVGRAQSCAMACVIASLGVGGGVEKLSTQLTTVARRHYILFRCFFAKRLTNIWRMKDARERNNP